MVMELYNFNDRFHVLHIKEQSVFQNNLPFIEMILG